MVAHSGVRDCNGVGLEDRQMIFAILAAFVLWLAISLAAGVVASKREQRVREYWNKPR